MPINTKFTHADFDTVDYYFAQCIECKQVTEDRDHWVDVASIIEAQNWELIDGALYCENCADTEHYRQAEEAEEDEEDAHPFAGKAMDFHPECVTVAED